MRSIALPALLVVTLAYTASANDKPVAKVSLSTPLRFLSLFSHAAQRPRKSKHLSSSSSTKAGKTGGHPLRPPRRRLLAVKHSPTWANGQLRRLPTLLSRATAVSLQRVSRLTTPFLPPSRRPSTFRASHSSFSMRLNTRRAATAAVDTSNCSRMASRPVERNSLTTLPGLSCLALTSLARAQRFVSSVLPPWHALLMLCLVLASFHLPS